MSFPDILEGQAILLQGTGFNEESESRLSDSSLNLLKKEGLSVRNIGETQVAFLFAVLLFISIFLSWLKQQDLAVVIYIKSIYSYLHSESDARSKL